VGCDIINLFVLHCCKSTEVADYGLAMSDH